MSNREALLAGTATSRLLDVHNFVGEKLKWHLQVLRDGELSATARLIAGLLMHDLNVTKRGAWRGQDEIARVLGINVRTVRRCIAELVARGHLRTTPSRGRGHAIVYEALLKADISRPEKADIPYTPKADISYSGGSQRRAPDARKADSGAPPFLEESFSPPLPPEASAADQELLRQVREGAPLGDVAWVLNGAFVASLGQAVYLVLFSDHGRAALERNRPAWAHLSKAWRDADPVGRSLQLIHRAKFASLNRYPAGGGAT